MPRSHRRTLITIMVFCPLLILSVASSSLAQNTTIESFNKAKKLAAKIFDGHETTFYCDCAYTDKDIDLASCGYKPKRDANRAHRLEWEHVVPAHAFGQSFKEWREVKVGVLARLARYTTRSGQEVTRLGHRRLVAVLGEIEVFKPRFWLEALRQGIGSAPEVIWLSDGGRGFWGLYEAHLRPHARGILDFYHAAQYLWKSAAAWLDGRSRQARQWFGWSRHRLRHGNPDDVLEDLLEALEVETLAESASEALVKLYHYLNGHRDHIDYAQYEELGLPLGSGMVESACKWLIQQRFKGVGMRWSEEGFNHLLHLRLAWVNGTFEALFQLQPSPNR